MYIRLDGVLRNFPGRLKERTYIDVEAKIGKRGCDDLRSAVMAVLTHLGHENAGPPALLARKSLDLSTDGGEFVVTFVGGAVNAGHGADFCTMAAEHAFHR